MTLNQRHRVSAYGAVIAVCALSALASAGHSADAPPPELPPGQPTGLPCGYEVAGIIQGPPQPALGTFVTGLNEHGWVSGYWHGLGAGSDRAYYWKPAFGESVFTIPLPTGYSRSFALDINDNGLVVGHMSGAGNPSRGFVYDTNTNEMVAILDPIDPAGFNAKCWANAINNDGVVVGARSLGETEQPYNAFIWTPNEDDPSEGTYTDLGVMSGGRSTATDVDRAGRVTGYTGQTVAPGQQAFLWADNELTMLGAIPAGTTSNATGMNNELQICANGLTDPEQFPRVSSQGAIWNDGEWELIGLLPGCVGGGPNDINDNYTVVGRCTIPGQGLVGFILHDGEYVALNELILSNVNIFVRQGRAINNHGQIVASGLDAGKNVGFLLEPIHAPVGDLTGSCTVGPEDLAVLLREWSKEQSVADLNGDGLVDGYDLAILLGNWTR